MRDDEAMLIDGKHRKRVQHFDDPIHVRLLTFSCYQRWQLLANDERCRMLSESIDRATLRHRYALAAFVYMPNHVHLLVYPLPNASRMQNLLSAIKRPFSFRVKKSLIEQESPLLEKLTIREGPTKQTFRFWQKGPGHDRNLEHHESVFAAINYLHSNPVDRGLVNRAAEWKWSSARWFFDESFRPSDEFPRLSQLPAEWLQ